MPEIKDEMLGVKLSQKMLSDDRGYQLTSKLHHCQESGTALRLTHAESIKQGLRWIASQTGREDYASQTQKE